MKLRQLFLGVLIAVLASSCSDKDPDPNTPPKELEKYATLAIVSGNEQTGMHSYILDDSLIMQVTTDDKKLLLDKFYVKSSLVKGNGSVMHSQWWGPSEAAFPNKTGRLRFAWKLGCDETTQLVTFHLFYLDSCNFFTGMTNCEAIDSVTFSASASTSLASGWVKICGIDQVDSYSTKIRGYGNEIYAVNYGRLYKLKNAELKYWEELSNVPDDVYDFGFDSNGRLYILTDGQGVFVTDDQSHWDSYGSGILDPRYPIGFLVEDSVVYASFSFDGMYRIRKNESFARKLLVNGQYHEEYAFPVRHPNGDMYVVDKWDTFWKSSDSGDSWVDVPIDWQYVNYETKDFKIHPSGLLYIGSGDASLAVLSPDTYTGDLYSYYEWNSSSQHIENIQFDGNDVYYLVRNTPSPGIYSSTSGWQKYELDFDKGIYLFHRMEDGTFLLGSFDGLYYRKP